MLDSFAHILLFSCPECSMPIAISRISDYKNLERIESSKVNLWCYYCHASADLAGALAKKHLVEPWPRPPQ